MRNNEVILGLDALKPPLGVGIETPQIRNLELKPVFNLNSFYQDELNKLEISRCNIDANVWQPILDRISVVKKFRETTSTPAPLPLTLKENQFQLITKKIVNELYKFEARVCGVKNMESFENLKNFFESNITKSDLKYANFKKNTSFEDKQKIILEWNSLGWKCDRELSKTDNNNYVPMYKNVPINIGLEKIPCITKLVTKDNNPIEITKNLIKLGIEFNENDLLPGKYINILSELYSHPNVNDVLKNAQKISQWEKTYSILINSSFGTVKLLLDISNNPNYKTEFSVEKNKKIDLLSKGLLIDVGKKEFLYMSAIIDNPDYLEFTSYIINLCKQYSYEKVPILDHLKFLDENNFIKPILELNRLGITLEKIDGLNFGNVNSPSLKSLFDNYVNRNKDIDIVRQEVGEYLNQSLQNPEIINFKNDSQNRDFVGLISHIRGYHISVEELKMINKLFGNNLEKKQNAILILKSICNKNKINYDYDINFISEASLNTNFVKALKNPEFINFIDKFKSLGIVFSKFDLSFNNSSRLLDVFNNPIIKEGFNKESTLKILKLFKGNFNLMSCEYYINLCNNPKAIKIIKCLDKYGINVYYGLENELAIIDYLSKNEDVFKKINSVKAKEFAKKLNKEFRWELEINEIIEFIKFFENIDLQKKLFDSKNYDYIKKVQPYGFSFVSLDKWLNLDDLKRQLMLDLISKIHFSPESDPNKVENNFEILNILLTDENFKNKLFSKEVIEKFSILNNNFRNSVYSLEHLTLVAESSKDFIPFLIDFSKKYGYEFNYEDVVNLDVLSKNKQNLYDLIDLLTINGYKFRSSNLFEISSLLPFADKLSDTLNNLHEIFSYNIKISDFKDIINAIKLNCSKEELIEIKNIVEKYQEVPGDSFRIGLLNDFKLVKDNESFIIKLYQYNYKFTLNDIFEIKELLKFQDKNSIFEGFDILKKHYNISFNPEYFLDYSKLTKIKDIDTKINDIIVLFPQERLIHSPNFKLFVSLNADVNLYKKSIDFLFDDYFKNIRDAHNRLEKFTKKIFNKEISDDEIIKIFTLSTKATELDQISHKYLIVFEISKGNETSNWHSKFLETTNILEANKFLTKSIVNLSIPIIYSNLENDLLENKKNQINKAASKNAGFDEILEINCRALGIYKQRYKNNSYGFNVLANAIQTTIELNLGSDLKNYHQKRSELSEHQFERIFEGMPENLKNDVTFKWMDLSVKNNITTTGGIFSEKEDVISRLNSIRVIIRNDLSIHLGQLIFTKINDFKNINNLNEMNEDQIKIYKEFLITDDGQLVQNIPILYQNVKKQIRGFKQKIKDVYLSPEENSNIGKKIGVYQGVADCLKSIYKLSSISEENYKLKMGYVNQIENLSGKFYSALKKLKLLDEERLSGDVNIRALENEVLHDFGKLKNTFTFKNISGQTSFQVESTVDFLDLAKAPEMTSSCQRLTEATGYNHAAYSRLLDGFNQMINISEIKNNHKNRVARSFIELSKIKINLDSEPRLSVLIDRLYTNPQFFSFENHFSVKMIDHLIDRFINQPEISILLKQNMFTLDTNVIKYIESRGYGVKAVSGEYLINESNVKLSKYYDSFGGENDVTSAHWKKFNSFYLIEKLNSRY